MTDQFIDQVRARLEDNKRVRRNLPQWGRIHIDRQLPFLCVYRRPTRRQDEGTERLIMGQPAYLTASSQKSLATGLSQLVQRTAETMSKAFGSFLIIEIWSGLEDDSEDDTNTIFQNPAFKIIAPDQKGTAKSVAVLENELANIEIHQKRAEVNVVSDGKSSPPRLPALLPESVAQELGCITIGIVVRPIYRQSATSKQLPLVHQALIREFNRALQRTFFAFVQNQTKYRPLHYEMLGRHATVKAVWTIDKQLAKIGSSFDFLLQVTPINASSAWRKFKRGRFEQIPTFHYRPHVVDPALLKRQLWNIHVERVEDPTLQHLFREKRKELDIQISMLGNINNNEFLYGSMQLYGELGHEIVTTAQDILERISPYSREGSGKTLNAEAFAQAARAHISQYQEQSIEFKAAVHVQNNISGLIVSRGNLLVGDKVKIAESRVEALLNHEVGTHLLTYYNGKAQSFTLLRSGLAGYDELQEGLAVLAEYLVGGLSKPRLRLLAARVVAAYSLTDGATFIDTFRLLTDTYQFKQQAAFNIVMRIYRAGGLTKDAIYLRGLIQLLGYLQKEPLSHLFYVGKFAIDHIAIIQELQRREVLEEPKLLPSFFNMPRSQLRLERISRGLSIVELIEEKQI